MTKLKRLMVMAIALCSPLIIAYMGETPLVLALVVGLAAALMLWLLLRTTQPRRTAPNALQTRQLLPENNLTEKTLESLPYPLMLLAEQNRVIFANAAAREIYKGFSAGVLLSTLVRHPEVLEVAALARNTGKPHHTRFGVRRPEERFFWVKAHPIENNKLALTFQDETKLHRAEHMRAGFLANVSHELRTPLASLSGYIETLRGHASEDKAAQEKFLSIMSDQAARMGRLIDDLLSLSRIEMDAHLPPKTKVDLNTVLTDACEAFAPITRPRQIEFKINLPDKPVRIIADHDQIIQIAQNLIDNAIKYTADGGVIEIEIKAPLAISTLGHSPKPLGDEAPLHTIVEPAKQAGQNMALLMVRDAGPGIVPGHLPRLGERFYRVEEGKSISRTGTGLGLAIVKHIVNRHRGGLSVQSAPGKGTAFMVLLPASQAG